MGKFIALAALLALGCSVTAAPSAPDALPAPTTTLKSAPLPPVTSIQVWAHSADLEAPARAAAARILAATGLAVDVNSLGQSKAALPLFWSSNHGKWIGLCGPDRAWLAVDSELSGEKLERVLIHEMFHAFGAGHVPDFAGIMSADEQMNAGKLTSADLVDVCAVAGCTTFAPEAL